MRLKAIVIISVLFVLVLAAAGIYGLRNRRNYELKPPSANFSGEWVVYSESSGKIRLVTRYIRGVKHGAEMSWYDFPDLTNTVQSYSNGLLEGMSMRFDGTANNRPLVSGRFVAGKPWEGTFLVWPSGEMLTEAFYSIGSLPDVVEKGGQYSNGVAVAHGTIGPQGLELNKQ